MEQKEFVGGLPQIKIVSHPVCHRFNQFRDGISPEQKEVLRQVRESMIGQDITFLTPFGLKKVVYADFTASGRLSSLVEGFMNANVYPLYANTHSNSSWGPIQTAIYREEARALIKKSVGASPKDVLLFCGSGSTAAIYKTVELMKAQTEDMPSPRMIVLVSKFEHHSNLLPWREAKDVKVIFVEIADDGGFDFKDLDEKLQEARSQHPNTLMIGSFSAGSNLTGQYFDVDRIAYLCHHHGALAFFDYACVGPYLEINMSGETNLGFSKKWLPSEEVARFERLCYKDAIFISPHKFIGGPGSSGILVMKSRLVSNNLPPVIPGGGTVLYVNDEEHIYVKNIEEREEAGTPNILGDIRAGLAFKLKNQIGNETICRIDHQILNVVRQRAKRMPNVVFHGNLELKRVPIFVVSIRAFGKVLHYNFVCNLLNDLFGIFTRGGCSCAGPYGHELLSIDKARSHQIRDLLIEGKDIYKMGFTRINFSYLWDQPTIIYLLDSLDFISKYGWLFLPKYVPNIQSGQWMHLDGATSYTQRESLHSFNILKPPCPNSSLQNFDLDTVTNSLSEVLQTLRNDYTTNGLALRPEQKLPEMEERKELQWFLTPQEAVSILVTEGLRRIDCSISATLENEMLRRKHSVADQFLRRSTSTSIASARENPQEKNTFREGIKFPLISNNNKSFKELVYGGSSLDPHFHANKSVSLVSAPKLKSSDSSGEESENSKYAFSVKNSYLSPANSKMRTPMKKMKKFIEASLKYSKK